VLDETNPYFVFPYSISAMLSLLKSQYYYLRPNTITAFNYFLLWEFVILWKFNRTQVLFAENLRTHGNDKISRNQLELLPGGIVTWKNPDSLLLLQHHMSGKQTSVKTLTSRKALKCYTKKLTRSGLVADWLVKVIGLKLIKN
jgi:hypothetical protein